MVAIMYRIMFKEKTYLGYCPLPNPFIYVNYIINMFKLFIMYRIL